MPKLPQSLQDKKDITRIRKIMKDAAEQAGDELYAMFRARNHNIDDSKAKMPMTVREFTERRALYIVSNRSKGATFADIAKTLDIAAERVRAIYHKTLRKQASPRVHALMSNNKHLTK